MLFYSHLCKRNAADMEGINLRIKERTPCCSWQKWVVGEQKCVSSYEGKPQLKITEYPEWFHLFWSWKVIKGSTEMTRLSFIIMKICREMELYMEWDGQVWGIMVWLRWFPYTLYILMTCLASLEDDESQWVSDLPTLYQSSPCVLRVWMSRL